MSTSSEKYELAQDEVDAVLVQLKTNIKKVEAADGEAKKRLVQVDNIRDEKYFKQKILRFVLGCLRMLASLWTRWTEKPSLLLSSSELRCWPMWGNTGKNWTVYKVSSPSLGCRDHHHHRMELLDHPHHSVTMFQFKINTDNRWHSEVYSSKLFFN